MNQQIDKPQASEHTPKTRGHTIHWAHSYDNLIKVMAGKKPAFWEKILELAQVKPGDKVLDVGCGPGNLAIAAQGWVGPTGEVHGIDAAPEMIDEARHKATRAGVDVDFQVGLIEDIPFSDNQFDVVLNSFVLHHLPDDLKREGFAETHNILKPGGRFLAVDFESTTKALGRAILALTGHANMQNDFQKLATMMEDTGFTEVETGRFRYRIFPISFVRGRVGG